MRQIYKHSFVKTKNIDALFQVCVDIFFHLHEKYYLCTGFIENTKYDIR